MPGRAGGRDADCPAFLPLALFMETLGLVCTLISDRCLKSLISEVFLLFNRSLSRHGTPFREGWPFIKRNVLLPRCLRQS